jgi:hypothetical protein
MEQELGSVQYISIIRLFEKLEVDTNSEINVSRIKKQLLAEFSIAENGIISIDSFNYNKTDILTEIEHVNFEKRLSYHKIIWNTKHLLELLETNKTNLESLLLDFVQIPIDENFDAFLSPYFAMPFNIFSRNLITNSEFENLETLLRFQDFILPAQTEIAFQSIHSFLESQNRILRNVALSNYGIMYDQIRVWPNKNWPGVFNMLPDEFYSIKDEIIRTLINLTVRLQKERKNHSVALSGKLINLKNIDPELSKLIYSNHEAFTGGSSFNWGWVIWPIIALIKIISIGGC